MINTSDNPVSGGGPYRHMSNNGCPFNTSSQATVDWHKKEIAGANGPNGLYCLNGVNGGIFNVSVTGFKFDQFKTHIVNPSQAVAFHSLIINTHLYISNKVNLKVVPGR